MIKCSSKTLISILIMITSILCSSCDKITSAIADEFNSERIPAIPQQPTSTAAHVDCVENLHEEHLKQIP
jgi:hypothetical protein